MNLLNKNGLLLATAAALSLTQTAAYACSSCGCTLGTDWATEGYSASAGLRVDLRYDFINQSELRHGSHSASQQDIANALASGSVAETQQDTLSRFYTLGLDYSVNHDWGVNVQLPYLSRNHSTIASGDTDAILSSKDGIGDVRILGRYQGLVDDRSLGLQLGLKLPTGGIHQNFNAGPGAGQALDRGLQLGTGSTDLLAGMYHFQAFSRNWDHFEQIQLQVPLNSREDFRPSTQVSANIGVRYVGVSGLIPQLQLNYKWEGRESGDQADRPNSGSNTVYLSPGLSYSPIKPFSLYGFVQLPVYRNFEGLQLAPKYSTTVGLRYAF